MASGKNPTYEEKEKDAVEEISLQRLGMDFHLKISIQMQEVMNFTYSLCFPPHPHHPCHGKKLLI